MATNSEIEWTDSTWNPVTGCTKISTGCDNCYAERLSERFRGVTGHPFVTGFDLTLRPERLDQPLRWARPRKIFVNSMSDLFHKGIPGEYLDQIFNTMERATWHVFQVLTKRSSRMRDYIQSRYGAAGTPAHVWLGSRLEDESKVSRIRHLRQTPAGVRFLSIERLIGRIEELPLDGIHWVIVGGESGPRARPRGEQRGGAVPPAAVAGKVIVADIDAQKRAHARQMGAVATIDNAAPDAVKQVMDATDGGAAAAIDFVGSPKTMEFGVNILRKGGKLVMVGLYGGAYPISTVLFPFKMMTIEGSYVGTIEDLKELLALVQAGKVPPIPIETRSAD